MVHVQREYATTVTGLESDLARYEAVLDALPEACLIGGEGFGTCALVFTVRAPAVDLAMRAALDALSKVGVTLADGVSVTVLEHQDDEVAVA